MLLRFNYKQNSKTPKGEIPSVRMITKDHDAYKVYLLAQQIQKQETGNYKTNVDKIYIQKAIDQIKNKKEVSNEKV